MSAVEVTLPSGRHASLRPLSGLDEVYAGEETASLLPVDRSTAILARSLEALDGAQAIGPHGVRALTVGDREALLLQLRRLTLGDRMSLVLTCPNPECGERMDLDLLVGDLLLPPYERPIPEETIAVREGDATYEILVRPAKVEDQLAVAHLAGESLEEATSELLRRCVVGVSAGGGQEIDRQALPPRALDALDRALAALDPQAEILLDLSCPVCQAEWTLPFDVGGFFFQELASGYADRYREVHLLALSYHWSEAEILGMTRQRRSLYLDLLAETPGAEEGIL